MTVAFFVCLPVYLLPAILALWRRQRFGLAVASANVLLIVAGVMWRRWAFPVNSIEFWMVEMLVAMCVATASWLVLLRFAARGAAAPGSDLDEEVTLAPHDPDWAVSFDAERRRVADALGLESGVIEHIGSTAVPDLIAKPVVDLMLGVSVYPPSPGLIERLVELGYEPLGEAGVPQRAYLRRRDVRHFNLHIVAHGGTHWTNNLALRELLRRDAAARERYAAAKRAAIADGGERLLAYSERKGPIVAELLTAARSAGDL